MDKVVLLFGLENINNIGEDLLGSTTEYLVRKGNEGVHCVRVQFYPRYNQIPFRFKMNYFVGNIVKWLANRFHGSDKEYILRNICYKIQYEKFFTTYVKQASHIIFTIGMLKYSTQNFSYIFELINTIASNYKVPVLMSAMSIEKRDNNDWRYHQLVRSVNLPSVKMITTRDGNEGVSRLHKDYILRDNIMTDFVGDPGLWIPELYKKKRHIHYENKKKIVGVNLIRKGIYKDYREEVFTDDQMRNLYLEIIAELERRGYEWFFFCNGMPSDYAFGKELLLEDSIPDNKLLPSPSSVDEYLETVLKCDAVFGARLHACISSVAMDIPVVGLLWDNKLDFFSKTMGIRQFFLSTNDLEGRLVVDKLEAAMNFQFDNTNRGMYKQKTKDCINLFMKNHHVK